MSRIATLGHRRQETGVAESAIPSAVMNIGAFYICDRFIDNASPVKQTALAQIMSATNQMKLQNLSTGPFTNRYR